MGKPNDELLQRMESVNNFEFKTSKNIEDTKQDNISVNAGNLTEGNLSSSKQSVILGGESETIHINIEKDRDVADSGSDETIETDMTAHKDIIIGSVPAANGLSQESASKLKAVLEGNAQPVVLSDAKKEEAKVQKERKKLEGTFVDNVSDRITREGEGKDNSDLYKQMLAAASRFKENKGSYASSEDELRALYTIRIHIDAYYQKNKGFKWSIKGRRRRELTRTLLDEVDQRIGELTAQYVSEQKIEGSRVAEFSRKLKVDAQKEMDDTVKIPESQKAFIALKAKFDDKIKSIRLSGNAGSVAETELAKAIEHYNSLSQKLGGRFDLKKQHSFMKDFTAIRAYMTRYLATENEKKPYSSIANDIIAQFDKVILSAPAYIQSEFCNCLEFNEELAQAFESDSIKKLMIELGKQKMENQLEQYGENVANASEYVNENTFRFMVAKENMLNRMRNTQTLVKGIKQKNEEAGAPKSPYKQEQRAEAYLWGNIRYNYDGTPAEDDQCEKAKIGIKAWLEGDMAGMAPYYEDYIRACTRVKYNLTHLNEKYLNTHLGQCLIDMVYIAEMQNVLLAEGTMGAEYFKKLPQDVQELLRSFNDYTQVFSMIVASLPNYANAKPNSSGERLVVESDSLSAPQGFEGLKAIVDLYMADATKASEQIGMRDKKSTMKEPGFGKLEGDELDEMNADGTDYKYYANEDSIFATVKFQLDGVLIDDGKPVSIHGMNYARYKQAVNKVENSPVQNIEFKYEDKAFAKKVAAAKTKYKDVDDYYKKVETFKKTSMYKNSIKEGEVYTFDTKLITLTKITPHLFSIYKKYLSKEAFAKYVDITNSKAMREVPLQKSDDSPDRNRMVTNVIKYVEFDENDEPLEEYREAHEWNLRYIQTMTMDYNNAEEREAAKQARKAVIHDLIVAAAEVDELVEHLDDINWIGNNIKKVRWQIGVMLVLTSNMCKYDAMNMEVFNEIMKDEPELKARYDKYDGMTVMISTILDQAFMAYGYDVSKGEFKSESDKARMLETISDVKKAMFNPEILNDKEKIWS